MIKPVRDTRSWVLLASWLGLFTIITGRLFYWQIIKGGQLIQAAENQYTDKIEHRASRGKIYTSDGYLLVGNQTVYRLFANPQDLDSSPTMIAKSLTDIISQDAHEFKQASTSADLEQLNQELELTLTKKLSDSSKRWVTLKNSLSEQAKKQIEDLKIQGLGFDDYEIRSYPEASMAATVTGFVGKDKQGQDIGYFGVEGALDKELAGKEQTLIKQTDALGLQMLFGQKNNLENLNGRDIVLTIRRDMQALAESYLQKGMEKYGSKSGEIVIMEPKSGKIWALASWPSYDQQYFYDYDPTLYKNPSVTQSYEPGSTFKTVTVSAGIDAGVIKNDTQCETCAGPKVIGEYTIRTWNNQYHPNITMTDALAKSDNTAMIFIEEKLGQDKFLNYLHKFKISEPLQIDLQEDMSTPWKDKWRETDLATASFGQGIASTTMQMMRAVNTIANHGTMMRPTIVEKVVDPVANKTIPNQAVEEGQVISPETAKTVAKMMQVAAEGGEAQWTRSANHQVAAKTGTSQVVVDGKYDETKTIASFIGFAPVEDPQFVMMVKFVEPQSSIWAAETAAPLWYKVADRLFLLLNIPPDK